MPPSIPDPLEFCVLESGRREMIGALHSRDVAV